MKLLADENFPGPVVETLVSQGHDVLWARVHCPGAKDVQLLDRAENEGRVVLTLDCNFWQLALQRRGALERSESFSSGFIPRFLKMSRRWSFRCCVPRTNGSATSASSLPMASR